MRHMFPLVLVGLLPAAVPASEPSPEPPPDRPTPKYQTPEQRVRVLFDAMRRGVYEETAFPDLGWEHIPALLERSVSVTPLRSYPKRLQLG